MAEPVIVPVQLEVTDVDTTNINFADASKQISKSMAGIRKQIQDVFKGMDKSAINKPIEKSVTSVKKSLQAAEDAQLRYNESLIRAGKSSKEYKSAMSELDAQISSTQQVVDQLSMMGVNEKHIAPYRQQLEEIAADSNKINPIDFVDKAAPIELERVANAYKKVLSAQEELNKQSEKFNQTSKDNRTSDEYNDLLKQAEEYKKKLEELDAKSKRMETLGATDKQWEALRYDTEQVSSSLDTVIKKMRTIVKDGSALRFGDGPKSDLSRQINSLAMSGRNRTGNIQKRTQANQSPYTEEYQKSLNELEKLEKKIEAIREKSTKMVELGASKKQFANLEYDAEQLDIKVDEVKNTLMGMVSNGKAFKFGEGNTVNEMHKLREKSAGLQSSLTGVVTTAKKAQGGLIALGATHPRLAAILDVASRIAVGFGKVLQVAGKVAVAIGKGFAGAVKVLGKVASAIGRVASGFVSLGKRIFSSIKNIKLFGKSGSTATIDMSKGFKKLTKNFLMFGLGFRTAYYAIKRLRNIFIEGFKVMGDQFDEVGEPMKELMESFNRLKGSLATAFQPLVSVVMPVLTKFLNYLTAVMEKFAKFTATLTGQGYIYKAVAKDINSVSSAAKSANNELGSYDKLEVIQDNNAGYEYEKQDIGATEDAASNFAKMVKEAWEKADFTGVGQYVTTKLLEVLDKVEQNIVPKVTNLVNRVLVSINTFLTGFDATAIGDKIGSIINTIVYGLDWEQLGALFANLNNTVWGFLDGLANGVNWTQLGKSFATGLSSVFKTLNLRKWVKMLSGFANGITTAIYNMLTNVDWAFVAETFATAVNDMFTSIDTEKIGTTINTLFNTLWTFVGNFFAKIDFGSIARKLATGISNIFGGGSSAFREAMPKVANGLVTFLVTAIEQINWAHIAETLFSSVMTILQSVGTAMQNSDNPIVSAFGDAVIAIKDAIDTLKPAVESIIQAVGPILEAILPAISELLPPIAEIISQAARMVMPLLVSLIQSLAPILTDLMQTLLPVILDLLISLQPIFDAIIDEVLPVIVDLLDACMPLIEGVLNLIVALLDPILELIGPLLEIISNILEPIITILEPVLSVLGTLCEVLGDVLHPILEALMPIMEALSTVFELLSPLADALVPIVELLAGVLGAVANTVTQLLKPALATLGPIFTALSGAVKNVATVFTDVFNTIKQVVINVVNAIKTPINSILYGIESVANGVIRGINGMINALNELSFTVPDWVPKIGGNKFGFNLSTMREISIPKLAQGAVIPPNKEFLAMLGDQKHGTNIEAPLDTIKQALAEVMAEIGGAGSKEPIVLQVSGRTLAKVVWDEQEKRYKQTGHAMA